jgi:N-acetylmuramoyl-L-alanine amidase
MFESALFCIATAIYWEARDQSIEGQLAVASVISNRVESKRFPNNPCDVVTQGPVVGLWPARNRCQFSFYCDGKRDTPENKEAFNIAISLAFLSLVGIVPDNTENALFYHADYVEPWWAAAMDITTIIGNHKFYRER